MGPYFVSPVVAGLDKISDTEWKPVVCTYDKVAGNPRMCSHAALTCRDRRTVDMPIRVSVGVQYGFRPYDCP